MCDNSLAPSPCENDASCGISSRFQLLFPSHRQVAHALLTRPPLFREPKLLSPFDLNVLGTPPAFILSQDQTLEIFLYTSLFRLTYLLFRARSALSYCLEYLLLESRVLALPVSISLYLVPLYFSRSHTSLYVCCSIFNDPIPLVPSRRQLCYYTTPPLACQPLLKSFFKFF